MKGTKTKLTTAPEGFEYYRVCDQEGVCKSSEACGQHSTSQKTYVN